MQQELVNIETQKRLEVENAKKREVEEIIQNANTPKKAYTAMRGDPVDELMARHINECHFYVPIERVSEGNYMFGQKKVFAKIMNGKLIIRVGGGFMTIDEYLRLFEQELRANGTLQANVIIPGQEPLLLTVKAGNGTPPRSK